MPSVLESSTLSRVYYQQPELIYAYTMFACKVRLEAYEVIENL